MPPCPSVMGQRKRPYREFDAKADIQHIVYAYIHAQGPISDPAGARTGRGAPSHRGTHRGPALGPNSPGGEYVAEDAR